MACRYCSRSRLYFSGLLTRSLSLNFGAGTPAFSEAPFCAMNASRNSGMPVMSSAVNFLVKSLPDSATVWFFFIQAFSSGGNAEARERIRQIGGRLGLLGFLAYVRHALAQQIERQAAHRLEAAAGSAGCAPEIRRRRTRAPARSSAGATQQQPASTANARSATLSDGISCRSS